MSCGNNCAGCKCKTPAPTRTKEEVVEYYNGVIDGVLMYAHWKDGEQFVGTTGKSFKEALKEIYEDRDHELAKC